jgi:hypothetical protein
MIKIPKKKTDASVPLREELSSTSVLCFVFSSAFAIPLHSLQKIEKE